VTRISRSFFRFGSVELAKSADPTTGRAGPLAGRSDLVKQLLELSQREYFSDKDTLDQVVLEISNRTGELVASWDAVGFTHGVMNTDNMSLVGETIDYGPYGFVEYYQPDFVPNTSDRTGRYALSEQRAIGAWNCGRLADALSEQSLLNSTTSVEARAVYQTAYDRKYRALMSAKLGLKAVLKDAETDRIIHELLDLMETSYADYTTTFRILSGEITDLDKVVSQVLAVCAPSEIRERMDFVPVPDHYLHMLERQNIEPQAVKQWKRRANRRTHRKTEDELSGLWKIFLTKYESARDYNKIGRMKEVNPVFILRNYLMQRAIVQAEAGDFDAVRKLLFTAVHPYNENLEPELLKPQSENEECNSLSCSS
jgi:uncharacterized protein YdiU (UPF0061 family)